jgi:hypothetical protein
MLVDAQEARRTTTPAAAAAPRCTSMRFGMMRLLIDEAPAHCIAAPAMV